MTKDSAAAADKLGHSHRINHTLPVNLEDRLRAHVISEPVRLRFIEHELRARRYFLLPHLKIWEQDSARWRSDMQLQIENIRVHQVLGLEAKQDESCIFSWPPVRPTHMPPAHFQSEAKGAPCHPNCLGKRGDQEILKMWRRCHRCPNGEGWTEIPRCAPVRAAGADAKRVVSKGAVDAVGSETKARTVGQDSPSRRNVGQRSVSKSNQTSSRGHSNSKGHHFDQIHAFGTSGDMSDDDFIAEDSKNLLSETFGPRLRFDQKSFAVDSDQTLDPLPGLGGIDVD